MTRPIAIALAEAELRNFCCSTCRWAFIADRLENTGHADLALDEKALADIIVQQSATRPVVH